MYSIIYFCLFLTIEDKCKDIFCVCVCVRWRQMKEATVGGYMLNIIQMKLLISGITEMKKKGGAFFQMTNN